MLLGMVSGFGLCIGILNFGGDRRRGRGSFGGLKSSFGISSPHSFQWDSDCGQRQVLRYDLLSFSRMIGDLEFWRFRCTLMGVRYMQIVKAASVIVSGLSM